MQLDDSDLVKGGIAVIAVVLSAFFSFFRWTSRRHIEAVDELDDRVRELEMNSVTRSDLDNTMSSLQKNFSTLQLRIDEVYRDMPKGQKNDAGGG